MFFHSVAPRRQGSFAHQVSWRKRRHPSRVDISMDLVIRYSRRIFERIQAPFMPCIPWEDQGG